MSRVAEGHFRRQCRVVKGDVGGVKEDRWVGVSPGEGTGPLVDPGQPVKIVPLPRGPVEYSVCHDHRHQGGHRC